MRFQAYDSRPGASKFAPHPMAPEDERFHPIPDDARYNWAETNMFGFNIPEHAIDCMVWYVYWPKLGATYGGITLWQGFKRHHLECEVFDFRAGLPCPADNTRWDCPNGVSITMVEPLEAFDISYRNAAGEISFDLGLRAAMPPALRYNGNHIAQALKTSGTLNMHGRSYAIDGYYMRDRSWREHRNEMPQTMPPVSWIAGVFGDDLSFHLTAFESTERRPEWKDLYPVPLPQDNVLWGFVWDGGRLLGVEHADMLIDRPDGLNPMGASIEIFTDDGKSYLVQGRTIALNPAMGWPNVATRYALTEWTCRGRTGWGDNQDVMFGDHVRHVARNR